MGNKARGIFVNDEWFAAFTAVMVVTGALEGLLCIISRSVEFVLVPFIAALGLWMFLSYKKHQKNVMKGLMGASLMWMLYEEVDFAGEVLYTSKAAFAASLGNAYAFFSCLKFLNVVLILLIFLLHFRINSYGHSRPVEVRLNQLFNILLIAFYLLDIFTQVFFGEINASQIVLMFFKTVLMFVVISIESRLDEFRIIKETKAIEAKSES